MQDRNPEESKNSSPILCFDIPGDTPEETRRNNRQIQILLESFPNYERAASTMAAEGLLRPGETVASKKEKLKTVYEQQKELFQAFKYFKMPEYTYDRPKIWENTINAFLSESEAKNSAPAAVPLPAAPLPPTPLQQQFTERTRGLLARVSLLNETARDRKTKALITNAKDFVVSNPEQINDACETLEKECQRLEQMNANKRSRVK